MDKVDTMDTVDGNGRRAPPGGLFVIRDLFYPLETLLNSREGPSTRIGRNSPYQGPLCAFFVSAFASDYDFSSVIRDGGVRFVG